MKDKLKEIYSSKKFQEQGHELVDLLAKYISNSAKQEIPVNNYLEPNEQLEFWRNYKLDDKNPITLFKDIIEKSIHIHNPKYIGHQVSASAPLAALVNLFTALLNNSMAIYEMGPASTAIEKAVVEEISNKIGYGEKGDGYITSGGTLANLTALLAARQIIVESNVWEHGLNEKLAVMVSAEAHYCVERACRIMGFGAKGIIKIPVGDTFTMKTELLDEYYKKAEKDGIKVIAVVGSAPSTSTGMHDDLEAIAQFCSEKKLWFHIDGAHGGGAIYSKKYKHLLKGIEKADSVVIDAHKMLMMPSLMTFLMFKNKMDSYATFSQRAQYLWESSDEEEWYNMAKRTFECTKQMMGVKFFTLLKTYGEEIFDQFVTNQYDLGHELAKQINRRQNVELAVEPESNIVCFRYFDPKLSDSELNQRNSYIRSKILKKGDFYIVQTLLNNLVYMRATIMNPLTTAEIFGELLDEVEGLGSV
ncbi:MAG: aminotransferase class I/II-fold pyridoxal phosphate-dependent enzyme [Saprospiraceae bacterium]|nr:aminotransferase class I/II-fold pyridoxal phosphate-dependent enzyme [Saprospiraceae bacterium]